MFAASQADHAYGFKTRETRRGKAEIEHRYLFTHRTLQSLLYL